MVARWFRLLPPAAQVLTLGVTGAALSALAVHITASAGLAVAPPALAVVLGVLAGVGRAQQVQRWFGRGRLDNRFLARLLVGYVLFAALAEAIGMPYLFPLLAAFTATVHLQWSGSRRWRVALGATFGVSAALSVTAATLDGTGVLVSPLNHDESFAFFSVAMLLGLLTVANAVALTAAREATESELETERTKRHSQLLHAATHDGLTGVLNRAGMAETVTPLLSRARPGHGVGILYLDLDGFKAVNDTLGHQAGDELLRVTARRIEQVLRSDDVVVRVGGDEFLVLVADVTGPDALEALRDRIENDLAVPFEVGGVCARVGVSIGSALTDRPVNDPQQLILEADAGMYRVKSSRPHRAPLRA